MSKRIKPQDGPQTTAARCGATVLVYGGAAGGGKSFFQAYRAAKHHNVKGYDAALFRRTFTMLQGSGSLWDECLGFYPDLGASYTTKPLEFRWPVGSRVEFRHLQHEQSAKAHKSKQYAYLGFDEATDFTGSQFTFMLSRLRTMAQVPKQFVLTTNPDPDSYLRNWVSWYISSDGTPDPQKSGITRYFIRDKDEVVWANNREDLLKYVDGDPRQVTSFAFIAATIFDNKILLENDPSYLGRLKSLPAVDQARYLGGNWDAKESAGDFYQKDWFKIWGSSALERTLMHQDGPGSRIVQSIRWWDFAGTPVKGDLVPGIERPADFKARDPATTDPPDWTVGVRLDRTADGRTIIADVKFARDTPGAIHALMARTAQEDGPLVAIGWWQDPGQAGVDQDERLKANMAEYGYAESISASKNKREYARDPSRAAFQGQLHYVVAPWNARFFNQLQDFPNPKEKDDAVDALSGAWHWLVLNPGGAYGYEAADHGSAIVMPGDADFFLPPSTRDTPHHRYQESTGNRFGRGRRVL